MNPNESTDFITKKSKEYTPKTKEEYEKLKQRVDEGAKFLEGKWQRRKYRRWVWQYEAMAIGLLNYEMENNLLPL